MLINPWLFPKGKTAALTMSYDDGGINDKRLVEIFNKYGIKGTFHIDSRAIESRREFWQNGAEKLYRGHEISVHTKSHPHLLNLNDSELMYEVLENKKELEDICGYTVRGMSYPYGDFDKRITTVAGSCGMKYARTVCSTNSTVLPQNFLEWHPSCHHNGDIFGLLDSITKSENFTVHTKIPKCLYVWGHSYEFKTDGDWSRIEEFCRRASQFDNIWFATNIEIYDYTMASRNLEISANRRSIFNPSKLSVWVEIDGKAVEIKPGENKL